MPFSKDTILKHAFTQFLKENNLSFEDIRFLNQFQPLDKLEYLNKRLSDIKFKNGKNTIVIREHCPMTGGRGDSIEFCDVSNGKKELIKYNKWNTR